MTLTGTKFRDIAKELERRIEDGTYCTGQLLPSESALIREFGVSRITIRQAVKLLAADGLVKKERGHGTTILEPHKTESRLRKGATFGTALRSDMLQRFPRFITVLDGVSETLSGWDAYLNIYPMSRTLDQAEFIRRLVGSNTIDGLFLWMMGTYTERVVADLQRLDFPFVFLNLQRGNNSEINLPSQIDLRLGDAVGSLLDRLAGGPITEIIVIGTNPVSTRDVCECFVNMNHPKRFAIRQEVFPLSNVIASLKQYMEEMHIDSRKLTVIADGSMLHFFSALYDELGFKIGEIPVLYFDDAPLVLPELKNRFTAILHPFTEFGRRAGQLMTRAIENRGKADVAPVRLALSGTLDDHHSIPWRKS
ncbi:MAG: GntR family transcriptional regulator [Victivallales bacterium]